MLQTQNGYEQNMEIYIVTIIVNLALKLLMIFKIQKSKNI